jgi:hypothetical protein
VKTRDVRVDLGGNLTSKPPVRLDPLLAAFLVRTNPPDRVDIRSAADDPVPLLGPSGQVSLFFRTRIDNTALRTVCNAPLDLFRGLARLPDGAIMVAAPAKPRAVPLPNSLVAGRTSLRGRRCES